MKKKLALMLAVSMLASMALPAFADDTKAKKEIGGSSTVKNPIIRYQVPVSVDFAIDPFQKAGDESGSQLFSPDFPIINKSDVAVQVNVKPLIVKAGAPTTVPDATVVTAASDVNQTDTDELTAQVFMQVVPSNNISATATGGTAAAPDKLMPYYKDGTVAAALGGIAVTPADTDGTAVATLEVTVDDALVPAGDIIDPSSTASTGSAFSLTFKDGDGFILGTVASGPVTSTAVGTPKGTEIAAAFNGKKFMLRSPHGSVEMTCADAAGTLTFTAASAVKLYDTAPTVTAALTASRGTEATVTVVPGSDYGKFSLEGGSANPGAQMIPAYVDGTSEYGDDALTPVRFVLKKGIYQKNYSNEEQASLFNGLATENKGVGSFRFMGTANPMADWDTNKFDLAVTFDVSGVTQSAYDTVEFHADSAARNVKLDPAAPTVPSTAINYTSGTDLLIPINLGIGKIGAKGIKTLTLKPTGSNSPITVSASSYTLEDNTIKLTVAKANTAVLSKMKVGANTFTVTFNDTASTAVDVTVTMA